jgi:hypothetical protein
MTNHLRRARGLSLRYALAELQRCQDLLRLSRDNIRTAMRQSPELPSRAASPQAAPQACTFSWFTEGFETLDLKQAKAVLESLT